MQQILARNGLNGGYGAPQFRRNRTARTSGIDQFGAIGCVPLRAGGSLLSHELIVADRERWRRLPENGGNHHPRDSRLSHHRCAHVSHSNLASLFPLAGTYVSLAAAPPLEVQRRRREPHTPSRFCMLRARSASGRLDRAKAVQRAGPLPGAPARAASSRRAAASSASTISRSLS